MPSFRDTDFREDDLGGSTEMENGLTRVITIIALTGLLVVGVAAMSILGRDSVRRRGADGFAGQSKPGFEPRKQEGPAGGRRPWRWPRSSRRNPPIGANRCGRPLPPARPPTSTSRGSRRRARFAAAAVEAEGCRQACGAEILCAAQRRADRRHQGAPEIVRGPAILLAAGGRRAARRGPQDSRDPGRIRTGCRSIPTPRKSSS